MMFFVSLPRGGVVALKDRPQNYRILKHVVGTFGLDFVVLSQGSILYLL